MVARVGFVLALGWLVALGCDEERPDYYAGCPGCGQGGAGCAAPSGWCDQEDGTTRCIDLAADEANCGGCGNACASGEQCVDGACGAVGTPDPCGGACGPTEVCDSGTCVDESHCAPPRSVCPLAEGDRGCVALATDPFNCGGCGFQCDDVCENGFCQVPTSCGALHDCSGTCVDLATDPANCGVCGLVCADDHWCSAGTCELRT
jgi:hypothetical protein